MNSYYLWHYIYWCNSHLKIPPLHNCAIPYVDPKLITLYTLPLTPKLTHHSTDTCIDNPQLTPHYRTLLEKSDTPEYRARERTADRHARSIEQNDTSFSVSRHSSARDNGYHGDTPGDEEAKYSAVTRSNCEPRKFVFMCRMSICFLRVPYVEFTWFLVCLSSL